MASDYEKKMIEMQFQLRENQQYLSDAFKDLESWSGDMKVKEEKLIRNKDTNINEQDKNLPPIRSLATVKKKKKVKKSEKNETKDKKTSKIKAYDYRNWDKFDVVRNNSL